MRVHRAELRVTRAAVDGEELVLAYRAPRPLPPPWSGELGDAGWLTLTPTRSRAALELLRGREDLEVGRAEVGLVADRPDPLEIGTRAEVVLEGALRSGAVRRLSAAEAEKASVAAAAGSFEPPPALSACIEAVERTPAWVLAAAAGTGVEVRGALRVEGWVGRDLLPLRPERVGLTSAASEPVRHLGDLSRIQLLVSGRDGRGDPMHLLLPADLAFLLQLVEFRMQPVPHFVLRSSWQASSPVEVPEDARRLGVRVTLAVTTRVRENVQGGGFWDTAWRVVLTPFTAAADAAIALGLGAGMLGAAWASRRDC